MITLFIDTRNNKEIKAKLDVNGKKYEVVSAPLDKRPESILNLINNLCQQAGIAINNIDKLNVEEGPGSYTGLKVGASVANALSFALGKQVNDKNLGEIVEPKYE